MRAFMTPELQWFTRRPMTELVRYRAEAYTQFRHGPLEPALALQDQIQLPAGFNPRTLELAQQLRREHGTGPASSAALIRAGLVGCRSTLRLTLMRSALKCGVRQSARYGLC